MAQAVSRIKTHAAAIENTIPKTPFADVIKEASGKFALHSVYHGKLWALDCFHTGVFDTQREMERDNKLNGKQRSADPLALERIGVLLKLHTDTYSQQCKALHQVARMAPAPAKYKNECLALCAPMVKVGDEAYTLADWLEAECNKPKMGQPTTLRDTDIAVTRTGIQDLLKGIDSARNEVYDKLH